MAKADITNVLGEGNILLFIEPDPLALVLVVYN